MNFVIEKTPEPYRIKNKIIFHRKVLNNNCRRIQAKYFHNDKPYTEPATVKPINFEENFNNFCGEERVEFGLNKQYKNNPIIVLGCSYAYGHGLKKEQSFSHILSELTERPILNFSGCGDTIMQSNKRMKKYAYSNEKNKERIKKAEYIIYVYMWDHINRYILYTDLYNRNRKPSMFDKIANKSAIGREILSAIKKNELLDYKKNEKNAVSLLKQIIIDTKEYAPNAKMIIIIYDEKIPDYHNEIMIKYVYGVMNNSMWNDLEKETDIKIIHTRDITGILFDKDYKLKEDIADWHPNEKAWKLFTPKFAEKYMN